MRCYDSLRGLQIDRRLLFNKDLEIGHRVACDQMLVNDAVENLGSAGVIPDAFRVNDGDGAAG